MIKEGIPMSGAKRNAYPTFWEKQHGACCARVKSGALDKKVAIITPKSTPIPHSHNAVNCVEFKVSRRKLSLRVPVGADIDRSENCVSYSLGISAIFSQAQFIA